MKVGGSGRGCEAIVTVADAIYVHTGREVLRLDPDTGATVFTAELSMTGDENQPDAKGYLIVDRDVVVAVDLPIIPPGGKRNKFGKLSPGRASSSCRRLVAFDRKTGEELWTLDAKSGFPYSPIVSGGGRVYVVDAPARAKKKAGEKAPAKSKPMLLAIDIQTGKTIWDDNKNVGGGLYVEKHDILISGGTARQGATGKQLWQAKGFSNYVLGNYLLPGGPKYGPTVFGYALDIHTGKITDKWFKLQSNCGKPILGEEIVTLHRFAGCAAYGDTNQPWTARALLPSIRPGCTENLMPVGGILCAESRYANG